jgi:S1-C subfamily serine protease
MLDLIMPKTVVQLAIWLLMFSLGAGLSGLIFFAIYQGQLNAVEERLIKSQDELGKSLDERLKKVQAGSEGSNEFRSSGLPPGDDLPDLEEVLRAAAPSVAGIEGVDVGGMPTSGSGIVIKNTGDEAWVLTNQHLVAGALGEFHTVGVRLGGAELPSEVYSVDTVRDLALVIFRGGGIRALRFALDDPKSGDPVWAVGAKGKTGSAVQGYVSQVNATSIVTDFDVPDGFSGGPLLDRQGRVIGVLSSSYSRSAADAGTRVAVPIDLACVEVVRCPKLKEDPTASPGPSPKPGSSPKPTPSSTPASTPTPDTVPTPDSSPAPG